MTSKTGLLLVNLGTPNAPSRREVGKYLDEFLMDGRVIDVPTIVRTLLVKGIIVPFRSGKSAKAYKELWTPEGSPLKVYGESLKEKVQSIMGEDYIVDLAMRYQEPSLEKALDKMIHQNVKKIIVFPLFPQYASATTGSVYERVMEILKNYLTIPAVSFVHSYHDHPRLVGQFAANGKSFGIDNYDHILFSFHGLPQRQLVKSDCNNYCLKAENCCDVLSQKNQFCYSAQCHSTAKSIASALSLEPAKYTICFQSRLGRDPWTQPYTEEVIKDLARSGAKKLLVFCPAFVADCLETTIEIGDEYKEVFEELGGEELDLVPSLNDSDEWAQTIHNIVLEH